MNRLTTHWHQGAAAFTLSELLIAVAILGLIAALAIPKVLISVETQRKNAIFKETFADLNSTLIEAANVGAANELYFNYLSRKMNAIKMCPTNSQTQGCSAGGDAGYEYNEPGYVMPNGAAVIGIGNLVGYNEGIIIDWNGNAGANRLDDDQLWLVWDPATLRLSPINTQLYNNIFSNR